MKKKESCNLFAKTNILEELGYDLKPGAMVLDFGCGEGRLLAALLEAQSLNLSKLHYVGVDANRARLNTAAAYAVQHEAESILVVCIRINRT